MAIKSWCPDHFHFYMSLLLLFRCPSLLIVGDTSPAVDAVVSDLSKTLLLQEHSVLPKRLSVFFFNHCAVFLFRL